MGDSLQVLAMAVAGALGAGATTALRSVLVAAMAATAPDTRHVYVVDAGGDDRLGVLAAWPHCGGVVRPHERERLSRLLRRLVGEVERHPQLLRGPVGDTREAAPLQRVRNPRHAPMLLGGRRALRARDREAEGAGRSTERATGRSRTPTV